MVIICTNRNLPSTSKKTKKNLDFYCFVIRNDLKTNENVPTVKIAQKSIALDPNLIRIDLKCWLRIRIRTETNKDRQYWGKNMTFLTRALSLYYMYCTYVLCVTESPWYRRHRFAWPAMVLLPPAVAVAAASSCWENWESCSDHLHSSTPW